MKLYATAASVGRSSHRPQPRAHQPLPPFDSSDGEGIVHTVLPPEQVLPPHFTDPAFLRADFNGVTLDLNRWGIPTPQPGRTLEDVVGGNSTPAAMLMTPMAPLYSRKVQDVMLTEHAERSYDDFVIDCEPWNAAANGRFFSPTDMLAWCQIVKSWGFRVVLWRDDPTRGIDAMLDTLLQAGVVNFYVHGEEVDSKMTAEAYEASLQAIDTHIGGRLPIGVHFTADGGRKMGYPIGFPRETFLNDWSPYNGRVHLCQQLDVMASAGLQGASMYYARLHVNCGAGDAARGPGAPDSRVIAFETTATAQLFGQNDETYGCLRSWELLCGTRDRLCARPVSGSANGLRAPDGSVL